jgi:hypothetical protein
MCSKLMPFTGSLSATDLYLDLVRPLPIQQSSTVSIFSLCACIATKWFWHKVFGALCAGIGFAGLGRFTAVASLCAAGITASVAHNNRDFVGHHHVPVRATACSWEFHAAARTAGKKVHVQSFGDLTHIV